MKKLTLLLFLFVFSCTQKDKTITTENLEDTNGLSYLKGAKTPYTGQTIDYMHGSIYAVNHFIEGKRNGISSLYYGNGTLYLEIEFKANIEEGIWREYYENGQVKADENRLNGMVHGPVKSYYENGQLKSKGQYEQGVLVGEYTSYHENGNLHVFIDSLGHKKIYDENGQLELIKK